MYFNDLYLKLCFMLKLKGYCNVNPQPFPYITIPAGATFPTTSSTATATSTPLIFSTPSFTFPTVLTLPTTLPPIQTLPPFPTLPPLFPSQQFPAFPPVNPIFPPPFPTFPTFQSSIGTTPFCPSGVVLCPPITSQPLLPIPGLPIPPITGSIDPRPGAGLGLRQGPNGCPCIDPRSSIAQTSNLNQRCTSPDNGAGVCVNVNSCQYFIKMIQNNGALGAIQIGTFIQRSMCGFGGLEYLVCCPASTLYNTNTNTNTQGFTFGNLPPGGTSPTPPSIYSPTLLRPTPYTLPTTNVCGISNFTQTRVVGGAPARVGAYPWIAALGYRTNPNVGLQFSCAGSLITLRHVLTTAHCISNNLYVARLGEYDLLSTNDGANPVDMLIEKKIIHENYIQSVVLNDIAMLKLQNTVPLTDQIRPICLPVSEPLRSQDLTGYQPFVAGWGSTIYQGPQSTFLREAQIPIVSLADCARNYQSYFPNQIFDNRVLCAGYGGRDTCQGDSGGPLMLPQSTLNRNFYFVLIGIVSYGYECARQGFPGVYTRVATYVPWIQAHLND